MIDSGICPWCRTVQRITSYGRQRCQSCGKPVWVEPDEEKSQLFQEQLDYWKSIRNELLAMEAELKVFGLTPHKMIAEVTSRIQRLSLSNGE